MPLLRVLVVKQGELMKLTMEKRENTAMAMYVVQYDTNIGF